jgi:hypothetical protein
MQVELPTLWVMFPLMPSSIGAVESQISGATGRVAGAAARQHAKASAQQTSRNQVHRLQQRL